MVCGDPVGIIDSKAGPYMLPPADEEAHGEVSLGPFRTWAAPYALLLRPSESITIRFWVAVALSV